MKNVTMVCPNLKCKAVLEVTQKQRGTRIRCKKCGQIILVPPRPSQR